MTLGFEDNVTLIWSEERITVVRETIEERMTLVREDLER